jgi:hypothetical protein
MATRTEARRLIRERSCRARAKRGRLGESNQLILLAALLGLRVRTGMQEGMEIKIARGTEISMGARGMAQRLKVAMTAQRANTSVSEGSGGESGDGSERLREIEITDGMGGGRVVRFHRFWPILDGHEGRKGCGAYNDLRLC